MLIQKSLNKNLLYMLIIILEKLFKMSQQIQEQDTGDGFKDWASNQVERFKGFFRGVRLDFPPKERALLQTYGNLEITHITVCRSPIVDALNKVLNVVSFGKWDNLRKGYGYDTMFHLFMLVRFLNNSTVRIEKNEVIRINNTFQLSKDVQSIDVPLLGKKLTLNEMFNTTIQRVGQERVFRYNAFSTNCQMFIMDVLESNGLMNESLKAFIYQDMKQIVEKLPSFTQKIGKATTDLAHRLNILAEGAGFDEDEEKNYRDYNDTHNILADDDEIENRFHNYHNKYISYM
jgi:hypothetical protein